MYPRCLLFGCCHPRLLLHVGVFFNYNAEDHYVCMRTDTCLYNQSLHARLNQNYMFNTTMTARILYHGLANLPPTPPKVYNLLKSRRVFKVLYLVQGANRDDLPSWYTEQLRDMIFLSFKNRVQGDLFFPNSMLSEGRLCLYLAARLLELQQGWLYNYYAVMDSDLALNKGSIPVYENLLMSWAPALASPDYCPCPGLPQAKDLPSVSSTSHIDFCFLTYHREVVEILHPWILDFDSTCQWSSQLMQSLEHTLIYRNHILLFGDVAVKNEGHSPYPKDSVSMFPKVFAAHREHLPRNLHHCSPLHLNENFDQLHPSGEAKRKGSNQSYHLMDTPFYYAENVYPDCQSWNVFSAQCCSIDVFHQRFRYDDDTSQ